MSQPLFVTRKAGEVFVDVSVTNSNAVAQVKIRPSGGSLGNRNLAVVHQRQGGGVRGQNEVGRVDGRKREVRVSAGGVRRGLEASVDGSVSDFKPKIT